MSVFHLPVYIFGIIGIYLFYIKGTKKSSPDDKKSVAAKDTTAFNVFLEILRLRFAPLRMTGARIFAPLGMKWTRIFAPILSEKNSVS